MRFIAAHADPRAGGTRWGVEPICRVLSEHGCPIAPSTYYAARAAVRRPSKQAQRDEQLKVEIARVHAQNYGVYGAGVPVHVLRKIAGHGSLATTQRYPHPDSASISAAGDSLTAFLRAPRSPGDPQLRAL